MVRKGHGVSALHRGATLIELMVALTISLFLIGGIIVVYIAGRAATLESEQLSRVQENVRFVSDYLVRELRNAGYRDQASLTVAEFNSFAGVGCVAGGIDCNFASISNNALTIRMSGTSSCAEPYAAPEGAAIVTNVYSVDNGSLFCEGSLSAEGESPTRTVQLASGIQSVEFSFICPEKSVDCGPICSLFPTGNDFEAEEKNLASTCQGVRAEFVFVGTEGGDLLQFPVTLTASFRNVALGRLKYLAIP